MQLTKERREQIAIHEARLEAMALKRGQKIVAQRWGYSAACVVRVDGLIGGRRV